MYPQFAHSTAGALRAEIPSTSASAAKTGRETMDIFIV